MEKKVKISKEKLVETVNEGIPATLVRSQSSCAIKTDSKGTKSYEVKVYADDAEDAVALALRMSTKLDKEMNS